MNPPIRMAVTSRNFGQELNLETPLRRLLDLGFENLVLGPGLTEEGWSALRRFLPRDSVCGAFVFSPVSRSIALGDDAIPHLASLDSDERREARKLALESVDFAAHNDLGVLLVPCPTVDEPSAVEVREAFESRDIARKLVGVKERRDRSEATTKQFDSFLSWLSSVLEHADRRGVALAVIPAGMPCELPDFAELRTILGEFEGAPVSVFADALRLERALRVTAAGVQEFLENPPESLSGVLVHDGDAVCENRPLGSGDLRLERILAYPGMIERARRFLWILDLAADVSLETLAESRDRLMGFVESADGSTEDSSPSLDLPAF